MNHAALRFSPDLPPWALALTVVVCVGSVIALVVESRLRRPRFQVAIVLSGVLVTAFAALAILRPAWVTAKGSELSPKVVVLVDRSQSMALKEGSQTRRDLANERLKKLQASRSDVRWKVLGFGRKLPTNYRPEQPADLTRSELVDALAHTLTSATEPPQALVVLSDGRLDSPTANSARGELASLMGGVHAPVHTLAVGEQSPADATIRRISTSGAGVAHQSLEVTLELGCSGGFACDGLNVYAEELLENQPPHRLAAGKASFKDGKGELRLSITLDRAGKRLVHFHLETPKGDAIPSNNERYLPFNITRDRVRVLHVAGRPTYDVRALRMWLKSNAAVDLIAFFILRTGNDDTGAPPKELALIAFPVDELFTTHLPSFDAVILQDFNSVPYGLERYLPNLRDYVKGGGGLVMVGGPDAFLGGGYAKTPLEDVLPVELNPAEPAPYDVKSFVPSLTAAGQKAPVLAPLRKLFGEGLPPMPGVNFVGPAKPGAVVLWEHPSLHPKDSSQALPVLTLGEAGDGRAVTIAVDGVHRLGFSEFAAKVAGRGHAALWDGLLGWLMRDPRYELAQVDLKEACEAGKAATLQVEGMGRSGETLQVEIRPAGVDQKPVVIKQPMTSDAVQAVPVGPFKAGGYFAKVSLGDGMSTRQPFVCETAGHEWADPRPDPARLEAIAKATKGEYRKPGDDRPLSLPATTLIQTERNETPVLPPWIWALLASLGLGSHWILRRTSGLS